MHGLTRKQQRFVEEYCSGLSATAAAKRAAYSAKTAYGIGSENLRKREIRAAMEERMARLSIRADEALWRLTQQARGVVPTKVTAFGEEARQEFNMMSALYCL